MLTIIIQWLISIGLLFLMLITAGHALLYKRDPRAAWAWIVTCVLLPPLGPLLYFLLGINRVRTRAKKLRWQWLFINPELLFETEKPGLIYNTRKPHSALSDRFKQIARISEAVTNRPLLKGNRLDILYNGEQAYPAMLKAIRNAKEKAYLCTYIFEANRIGQEFIHALANSQRRGVDVKVLIDGIGEFYYLPRAGKVMERSGINFARFLPPRLKPPSPFINLRTHRKLLIVDGHTGFTGGMNIGNRHLAENLENPKRMRDIHFRLTGPVVNQMEEVFLGDWKFCTEESEHRPSPQNPATGQAISRVITVGPDQDFNKLGMVLVGAVSLAQKNVSIMTPYFLPSRELIGALQCAALRGVEVNIILPAKNNLPYVHWATQNMLWELLIYGVKVYYQPPPFAHSKLFLMDDFYAQIGSANLDPRSLRLNFELVVEVFDQEFAENLAGHINKVTSTSHELSLQEVDARSFWTRTRDSICWLFSPYL